jgi:hypothetical protein
LRTPIGVVLLEISLHALVRGHQSKQAQYKHGPQLDVDVFQVCLDFRPVFATKLNQVLVVQNVFEHLRHFTELQLADIALKTLIEIIGDAHFLPFDTKNQFSR